MGYTCAALSFALENINKPVIVTGAQVPLGYMGSDATTNLVNALRLSIWVYNSIKGVMAVFGSKVISGVRVKKGTDFDYDPFKSFIRGSLGEIGRYIRIDIPALDKYIAYLSKVKPLAQRAKDLSVFLTDANSLHQRRRHPRPGLEDRRGDRPRAVRRRLDCGAGARSVRRLAFAVAERSAAPARSRPAAFRGAGHADRLRDHGRAPHPRREGARSRAVRRQQGPQRRRGRGLFRHHRRRAGGHHSWEFRRSRCRRNFQHRDPRRAAVGHRAEIRSAHPAQGDRRRRPEEHRDQRQLSRLRAGRGARACA